MLLESVPSALPDSPLDILEDLNADLALTMSSDISLEALLAESMADKRRADEVKAARATVAKGGLAQADKDALTASIRSWEAKREWHPQAAVVMFTRQKCTCCGSFHVQFLGWYQRQQHRTSRIDRWIPSIKPHDAKLPRESKYQDSLAEMCEDCAEGIGFEVEDN